MSLALSTPLPGALERRYDGPVPPHAPPPFGASGLIQRLAAQSREQGAKRRRQLLATQAKSDSWLRRHNAALADYREMAVSTELCGGRIP
ncbi:hypothetical protein [Magnetospirillum sp. 64-120]|uniref:hypothetical protein n=1 Tax=Magnetospirillum sp. 64-120 TaxID=1895778 RepID=UPI00092BF206|nr:hypothetical protein [Magnetospirillum sp. 64-120]OJX70255.1 MAG: hypothetical protein BGO92_06610 [Magnetospirillum sp. 64-120]